MVMRLLLTLLVIPLLIVLAVKSPRAVGHLVELVIVIGARILDGVATLLGNILGSH
jgi:hypothetical protein